MEGTVKLSLQDYSGFEKVGALGKGNVSVTFSLE